MANQQIRGEGADRARESSGKTLADNEVELRLPAKPEYLPVLRATVGVIAGSMSLNYDEILHVRVAVSEAFSLAVRHLQAGDAPPDVRTAIVSFVISPDRLEVQVTDPIVGPDKVEDSEEAESRAVIESLMDDVEFGAEAAGRSVIRLVKRIRA